MTDLTDEELDKLVARLHDDGLGFGIGPALLSQSAAAVITALRQREAEAVAGAIEAASGIAMDFHVRALVWAKSVPGLDKHVGETDSYRIAAAIRALHTDATRAALDKVRAEGMREAVEIAHRMALTDANMNRTWRAGCADVAEAIHRAADKLEGKP